MTEQDDLDAATAQLTAQAFALTQRLGAIKLALEETSAQMREVVGELRKLRALAAAQREQQERVHGPVP